MTEPPPPLVTFTEMLRTALGAAAHRVAEGSRHNALVAITAREADAGAAAELLAALAPARSSGRRSA
jgi:hypothetical protein